MITRGGTSTRDTPTTSTWRHGAAPKDEQQTLRRVGPSRVNAVLRQITSLLAAGCTLRRALECIALQTTHPQTLKLVESMSHQIASGASLAAAMSRYPRQFPPLYVALVQTAQTGGFLRDVLLRITQYSKQRNQLVEKVRTALIYPAVLSITALASIVVLMVFIVPRFVQVYQMAEHDLPWPTVILLGVSHVLTRYWYLFTILLVVLLVFGNRFVRWLDLQVTMDRFVLKLPIAGAMLMQWNAAQFARTLGLLNRSGVPMLRSLPLAAEVASNRVLKNDLKGIVERVAEGAHLAAAMRQTRMFPPTAIEMVAVGEQSSNLSEVLDQLADEQEQSVDRALGIVTTLLEPAIILIMGAVIGFVVIALMLPVLLMSNVLG